MSTQFGDKYRKWAKVKKATMRIQHKPGDVMEVDWAGNTLTIWDSVTGESSPVYLFVAVLPCSGYAYGRLIASRSLSMTSTLLRSLPTDPVLHSPAWLY